MLTIVALLLLVGFFALFFGFIRFCQWVLSRREVTS